MSDLFLESISSLPRGFHDLAKTGELSFETIQIVQRIAITQQDKWLDMTSGKTTLSPCHPLSRFRQQTHLEYSEACPALNSPTDTLEQLLCLALMRYCVNTASRMRPKACIFNSVMTQLRQKLAAFEVHTVGDRPQRRCLLWVYLVWMDSATASDGVLTTRGSEQIEEISSKFPEIASWKIEDFERLGEDFFWSGNMSTTLKRCWRATEGTQCKDEPMVRSNSQPTTQTARAKRCDKRRQSNGV